MSLQQTQTTSVINDRRYTIELAVKNGLTVEQTFYPIFPAGNHVTTVYDIRTTTKRAIAEGYCLRDNWNGSGSESFGKVYLGKEIVLNLIKEAEEILNIQDKDDREYEIKEFVEKVIDIVNGAEE